MDGIDAGEERFFSKRNERLKYLGLAREMPIDGGFGYTDVALELQRTPKSVNAPRPAARGVERLLADDSVDGEWNLGGMKVDGKSTPIRARPDKF